jgi:hypothetical protein
MTRTFPRFALLLIVSLALPSSGSAVAGPPEMISGKMVFDEVADGLRQYRKAKDTKKRIEWLQKLALTHDPRVAVALRECLTGKDPISGAAFGLLDRQFVGCTEHDATCIERVCNWWEKNGADLCRRAKQFPQ